MHNKIKEGIKMLKYISSLLILFTFSVADMIDYYMMAILPSLPKEQAPIPNDGTLTGKVQKGPFKAGTVITVQEINKQLDQTGTSFSTEVINNLGDYRLNFNTNPIKMAEFFALGYYFDEVNNQVSSSQLQLSTISDFSYKQSVNINIISSLLRPRIRYLISNEGKDFQQAKDQAENEVLAIFNITDASLDFEDLDISVEDESNAILLAISAILMQQATDLDNGAGAIPGRLTEIITLIKYDIETDGVLDDQSVLNGITDASQNLNIPQVRSNLINYGYTSLPAFEQYVDSDGDGNVGSDEKVPVANDMNISLEDIFPSGSTYVYKHEGLFNASDEDDARFTFTIIQQPQHGSVTIDDQNFTYMVPDTYSGLDTFTYRANDGSYDSNVATVTFNINIDTNTTPITTDRGAKTTSTGFHHQYSEFRGGDILLTSSNEFIAVGVSTPYKNFSINEYLKDGSLSLSWDKNVTDYVSAPHIIKTQDGGMVLGGGRFILKYNSVGEVVWQKDVGDYDGGNRIASLIEDDEGSIIVYRQRQYISPSTSVIKYDINGDLVWEKFYGWCQTDYAKDIIETSDNNYVIAGHTGCDQAIESNSNNETALGGGDGSSAFAVKIDKDGNEIWKKSYVSYHTIFTNVIETPQNELLFIGGHSTTDSSYNDVWVVKTDLNGVLIWQRKFHYYDNETSFIQDVGSDIVNTDDNTYILSACTGNRVQGEWDCRNSWFAEIDYYGDLIWKDMGVSIPAGEYQNYNIEFDAMTDSIYYSATGMNYTDWSYLWDVMRINLE